MSQYASTDDFASLGLPARVTKNVTSAKITEFLEKASGTVDTYIRSKVTLPLAGTLGPPNTFPPEIVEATVAIARYRFLIWRGFQPDEFDSTYSQLYRDAMTLIKDISAGRAHLDVDADATVAVENRPRVSSQTKRGWQSPWED